MAAVTGAHATRRRHGLLRGGRVSARRGVVGVARGTVAAADDGALDAVRSVREDRRMAVRVGFGVDVGGSGIKGAPVDLGTGEFLEERLRIPTPEPATPEAVADVVVQVVDHFRPHLTRRTPVGITMPGVVQDGVLRSAANIDRAWIECDAGALFAQRLGRTALVVNDADAAGVAELRYGAARGAGGLVIVATLGTGIGTALIHDGVLIPNSELGHLEVDGHDAESRAAASIRKREDLTWAQWGARLQRYFEHVESLLWPQLFVVGGGVSKRADQFLPMLRLRTPIVAATLLNTAGIVGAAALARDAAATRRRP